MQNKARMVNRLPEYMNAENKESLIHSVLDTVGKEIENAEDRITDIMTSKWFPVAALPDLERLGNLFSVDRLTAEQLRDYKQRLFSTVQELLKGVGTVESIRALVTATMGFEPDIIENPKTPVSGGPRLLKAGDKWIEECKSVIEPKPTISIHSITTVRNPTIANLKSGESISYNGLLRPGAFLLIHPDGKASLAGIDVTDRIIKAQNVVPSITRPRSEWVYQDLNAFLDSSKFGEATLAGGEKYSVIVELRWEESKPASFIVKLPLYSNKYRPTEELSDRELRESIGYEQELRQEVRNLVEKVKTAGVEAQINFWDDFVEKISIKDEMYPQFNNVSEEAHTLNEELTMEGTATLLELHEIRDRLDIAGAFDITTFDSENRFG
ncbi:hypothetical protein [[Eubacterium] cellulosolvens]